jgi:hypothetical protein
MAETTQDIATLIAEVEGARAEATPGEWGQDAEYIVAEVPNGRPGGETIGNMRPSRWELMPRPQRIANATCIAVEHNAMPRLLAYIRELEVRLQAMRNAVIDLGTDEAPR